MIGNGGGGGGALSKCSKTLYSKNLLDPYFAKKTCDEFHYQGFSYACLQSK